MQISLAVGDDLADILQICDETVAWLVSNGRPRQWGSRPWSERPAQVERIATLIKDKNTWVARSGTQVIGVIAATDSAPDDVSPAPGKEKFIRLFATDRSTRGSGVGKDLLLHLESESARAQATCIRVLCYTGAGNGLRRYYENFGFTEIEPYSIGKDGIPTWFGALMQRTIS
ncbi:GNAT family N-acetyltransferase [Streptomyces sp. NPDC006285]|uniref:GNAT family N-acetyltransferase n=1 Tax=Streptomyces sp. NPDC006285 TaxID=3364742 RepID=UPI00369EDF6E